MSGVRVGGSGGNGETNTKYWVAVSANASIHCAFLRDVNHCEQATTIPAAPESLLLTSLLVYIFRFFVIISFVSPIPFQSFTSPRLAYGLIPTSTPKLARQDSSDFVHERHVLALQFTKHFEKRLAFPTSSPAVLVDDSAGDVRGRPHRAVHG